MNNIIKAFTFFLFFSSTSYTLIAQSYLSFGYSGVQHEDTLYIGDSIHFSFWLVNEGNITINDSVSVLCETFDIVGTSISSMPIGGIYNANASLSVGDSLYITISEIVTYQSYVLGDNIVVIWPASLTPGYVDTSVTNVYILDNITADITLKKSNNISLNPNPVSENLYLCSDKDHPLCSIIIYDSFGNILFKRGNVDLKYFVFNVSVLRKGMYFIVIIADDKEMTKKIIVH